MQESTNVRHVFDSVEVIGVTAMSNSSYLSRVVISSCVTVLAVRVSFVASVGPLL